MLLIRLLLVLGSSSASRISLKFVEYSEELDSGVEWSQFKQLHDRKYEGEEEKARREIFKENCAKIAGHNKLFEEGRVSFKMGINQFTDLTGEERMAKYTGLIPQEAESDNNFAPDYEIEVPPSFDWRTRNAVTRVKNQGECGSCYAFSATGSLEGQSMIRHNQAISLSEQNIIDCSGEFGNQGCDGGLMNRAFDYVISNGGIDTEELYPYRAEAGRCRYVPNPFPVSSHRNIRPGNETDLLHAVFGVGPISVAIDVMHDFFAYSGGVYYNAACTSAKLNHGVLVVGYGVEKGNDYWLVKNSWGEGWGLDGYVKMSRNKDNQCGISSAASFPIL